MACRDCRWNEDPGRLQTAMTTPLMDVSLELDLIGLYEKYDAELRRVCGGLRRQYHLMLQRGHKVGFGDVEGEIVYLLLRETRPEVVFEISSAAGWSTNYVLAALTANQRGVCHSFELCRAIRGRPTERVIRSNQFPAWDQHRLVIHLGDAQATASDVNGTIGFLLLDGRHTADFAQWYIHELFPRVDGLVVVQDIAFDDHLEPSSEAQAFWHWAQTNRLGFTLIGAVEAELATQPLRRGFPERLWLRSNAVLFRLPHAGRGDVPTISNDLPNSSTLIQRALTCEQPELADALLNQAVTELMVSVHRANRHREFVDAGSVYAKLGGPGEASRCFRRALGVALLGDAQQRAKGLVELVDLFLIHRQYQLAATALLLSLCEAGSRGRLAQSVLQKLTRIAPEC